MLTNGAGCLSQLSAPPTHERRMSATPHTRAPHAHQRCMLLIAVGLRAQASTTPMKIVSAELVEKIECALHPWGCVVWPEAPL